MSSGDQTSRFHGHGNPRDPHGQYIGAKPSDTFDWDNALTRFKTMMRKMYR